MWRRISQSMYVNNKYQYISWHFKIVTVCSRVYMLNWVQEICTFAYLLMDFDEE